MSEDQWPLSEALQAGARSSADPQPKCPLPSAPCIYAAAKCQQWIPQAVWMADTTKWVLEIGTAPTNPRLPRFRASAKRIVAGKGGRNGPLNKVGRGRGLQRQEPIRAGQLHDGQEVISTPQMLPLQPDAAVTYTAAPSAATQYW
ncbi:TPA: hypothetical protein ACH3X2_002310 [Trebouxia sp. C0005]